MYFFCLKVVSAYYKFFCRAKFHGVENLPAEGGVLVCPNHKSNNDPVIVASHINRKLRFMAKKELFRIPILCSIVKAFGAFPIDRSTSDLGAVRATMSILKEGHPLMIFPEGRRNKEFLPEKIKPGAVSIAAKAGVPIMPVYIKGKYRPFKRTEVFYGKPIPPEKLREVVENAAKDSENKNQILSRFLYDSIINAEGDCKVD